VIQTYKKLTGIELSDGADGALVGKCQNAENGRGTGMAKCASCKLLTCNLTVFEFEIAALDEEEADYRPLKVEVGNRSYPEFLGEK